MRRRHLFTLMAGTATAASLSVPAAATEHMSAGLRTRRPRGWRGRDCLH